MANPSRYRNKYNKIIVMTLTTSPRRFLRSVTGEAPATSQPHKNHNQAINAGSALLLVLAFVLTSGSYLFCRRRRRCRASLPASFPDPQSELDAIAIVIYSRPQGRNQDSDSEAENCVICLAEFEVGENVRVLPRCKHIFHVDCIDRWLVVRSLHCPVCRDRTIQAPPQPVKTSCNSSAHDTASLALVEFGTTRTFAGHITSYI